MHKPKPLQIMTIDGPRCLNRTDAWSMEGWCAFDFLPARAGSIPRRDNSGRDKQRFIVHVPRFDRLMDGARQPAGSATHTTALRGL